MKKAKAGFTLLEALIALSLVTVLMAVAWSLFATFSRLENRARKTVASLEITRSLRRQMQNDLDQLAILIRDSDTTKSPDSKRLGNLSAENLELESLSELVQPSLLEGKIESMSQDTSIGVIDDLPSVTFFEGTSQSLSFLIKARGEPGFFSEDQLFFVVSYKWRNSEAVSEQEEIDLPEDSELGLAVDEYPANPVRREFVRTVMTYRDYQSRPLDQLESQTENQLEDFESIEVGRVQDNTESEAGPIREQIDLLPEIAEIEFRFFDGSRWKSSWSDENLPIAIEVVFRARSEEEEPMGVSGEAGNDELDFGSEIEIGEDDSELEESFGNDFAKDEQIPVDFDPESKRFLIRIGSRQPKTKLDSGDPEEDSLETLFGEDE